MSQFRLNNLIKRGFWLLLILDIMAIYFSQSTFDSGDSVLHFLQAKQAFHYPKYFLGHWSKPFFVLLASPFAQFGFIGMKLFNSLCVIMAAYLAFLMLEKRSEHAWLIIPIVLFSPEFFLSQASGLTEPLFALMLTGAIYALTREKLILGYLILSLLPFVRSEGWFILPFFMLYGLINKQFRFMPWLLFGHIVYGIAGFFYYHDFLWMFHQNPYQGIEAKYGNGHWFHYIQQTPYLLGIPIAVLFFLGIVKKLIQYKTIFQKDRSWETWLLYAVVIGFYAAHSIFWHFGWFHSFGLKRVFIAVIPLMGIIAWYGAVWLTEILHSDKAKNSYLILLAATLIVFPFTKNKTGFGFPDTFKEENSQFIVREACKWLEQSPYKNHRIAYGNHFIGMVLQKDIDNPDEVLAIGLMNSNEMPDSTVVLWDSYFAPSDQGITEEMLSQNSDYTLLKAFSFFNRESDAYKLKVYLKQSHSLISQPSK